MVPLDGIDLESRGRSIAKNAGITGLQREVKKLNSVTASSSQKGLYRICRIHLNGEMYNFYENDRFEFLSEDGKLGKREKSEVGVIEHLLI